MHSAPCPTLALSALLGIFSVLCLSACVTDDVLPSPSSGEQNIAEAAVEPLRDSAMDDAHVADNLADVEVPNPINQAGSGAILAVDTPGRSLIPALKAMADSLIEAGSGHVEAGLDGDQKEREAGTQRQGAPDLDASLMDAPFAMADAGRSKLRDGSADSGAAMDASPAVDGSAPAPEPDVEAGASAGPLTPCEAECQAVGARCVNDGCVFNCESPGSCPSDIRCPDDYACSVSCGAGACGGAVFCPDDATCDVACSGADSCAGPVECAAGSPSCQVLCSGEGSCAGGALGGADRYDLRCSGRNSCAGAVSCSSKACDVQCSGTNSCGAQVGVFADESTVECTGPNSCDSVTCSSGRCDVRCDALRTCLRGVTCNTGSARGDCP